MQQLNKTEKSMLYVEAPIKHEGAAAFWVRLGFSLFIEWQRKNRLLVFLYSQNTKVEGKKGVELTLPSYEKSVIVGVKGQG